MQSTNDTFVGNRVAASGGGVPGGGAVGALAAAANGTQPAHAANSNALVPSDLTTDLGGNPRIAGSRRSCWPGPANRGPGGVGATFKLVPSCSAKVKILTRKLTEKKRKARVKLS